MDWSRKQILSYATYLKSFWFFFFQISYLRESGQGKYFSNKLSEMHKLYFAYIFCVQDASCLVSREL